MSRSRQSLAGEEGRHAKAFCNDAWHTKGFRAWGEFALMPGAQKTPFGGFGGFRVAGFQAVFSGLGFFGVRVRVSERATVGPAFLVRQV